MIDNIQYLPNLEMAFILIYLAGFMGTMGALIRTGINPYAGAHMVFGRITPILIIFWPITWIIMVIYEIFR